MEKLARYARSHKSWLWKKNHRVLFTLWVAVLL